MKFIVTYFTEAAGRSVEEVDAPSRYAAKKSVKLAHRGAVILGMAQVGQDGGREET